MREFSSYKDISWHILKNIGVKGLQMSGVKNDYCTIQKTIYDILKVPTNIPYENARNYELLCLCIHEVNSKHRNSHLIESII